MKKTAFIFASALMLLALASCQNQIEPKNRVFYQYFDTVCTLYDYTGLSDEEFDKMASDVEEQILKYHMYFDIYNEYEGVVNLAYINKTSGKIKVDKELFDFIEYSKQMHNLTRGEVNIAFGAVLSIWHDCREEGLAVPDISLLQNANTHTDIEKLALYENELSLERLDACLTLDAGAIGKGYACEKIGEYIREKYGEGFVLDFGGNLKAVGTKPDGSGWKSGVKNPLSNSQSLFVYTFEIKNQCAVTSGNYERFYTVDGINYHHIIDKDTLMPQNTYTSVTVIAESSALADALSTAFFNMTEEEIKSTLSNLENAKAVIVYPSGNYEIVE